MRTNHNASGKPSLEGCVGLRYLFRQVLQATSPWVCGILTDKDGNVIRFMPDYFDTNGNFTKKYPVPQTAKEYLKNIEIQKEIVKKRNKRIYEFVNQ